MCLVTRVWFERYECVQENGEETLEELHDLFNEMFQADIEAFASDTHTLTPNACSTSSSSSYFSYRASSGSSNKRGAPDISRVKAEGSSGFDAHFQSFCFGVSSLARMRVPAFTVQILK